MFNKHEFLDGPNLENGIFDVFNSAHKRITIVSPYIKLYDKLIDNLSIPLKNKKLRLRILFGKNYKWTKEDVDFIKRFPHVVVKYRENLHTKFYANERLAISTTMNLLEASFKNNYETGVLIEYDTEVAAFLKRFIITAILYYAITIPFKIIVVILMPFITLNLGWFEKDSLTRESKDYINELFETCDNIVFEKSFFESKSILKLKKEFTDPTIKIDRFPQFTQTKGFCIRSGVPIDYNPNQPYSREKYYEWIKEGSDRNQKENFCHKTGKPSYGETSINYPILHSS